MRLTRIAKDDLGMMVLIICYLQNTLCNNIVRETINCCPTSVAFHYMNEEMNLLIVTGIHCRLNYVKIVWYQHKTKI